MYHNECGGARGRGPQMVRVSTTTEGTRIDYYEYLMTDKGSGKLGFEARERSLSQRNGMVL
jgi:hypothetical protein